MNLEDQLSEARENQERLDLLLQERAEHRAELARLRTELDKAKIELARLGRELQSRDASACEAWAQAKAIKERCERYEATMKRIIHDLWADKAVRDELQRTLDGREQT